MTQYDFGGFDPTFFGVSLNFSNLGAARLFDRWRKTQVPLPIADLPVDDRFEALSLFSVLAHEVRHFHDALLAPYGAMVFHRRIQMLVNLLELSTYLFDDHLNPNVNCLPVPLERWWRLTESQRTQWIAGLPPRADGTPWQPMNVPLFNDRTTPLMSGPRPRTLESLDELLHAVSRARAQISDLTFNPQTVRGTASFQPWQVFELSGLFVQFQELWQMYGPEEVQFFGDYIMRERTPYATALFVAGKLCGAVGLEFNWGFLSIVAGWCLLGSYKRDGWNACPSVRFARLTELLAEDGVDLEQPIERLFAHWSQRLRVSTIEEAVTETRALYSRIPSQLEAKVASVKNSFVAKEYAELLIRTTADVARASAAMADAFLHAPETYLVPYSYNRASDQFVNPSLRFIFESLGADMDATPEELEQRGWIVRWALQRDGRTVVLSYIQPLELSPLKFVAPEDAAHLSDLFGLTEFVFSELGHERSDVQRAGRVFFHEAQIEPIQVF